MEDILGLLRIRVRRGMDLIYRDTTASDPFVVVTMADQKLKTRVVKNHCNPEWNDDLTLSIKDITTPIKLAVYDKDSFTVDDELGEADIDIKPYTECIRSGTEKLSDGTKICSVEPNGENCLDDASTVIWNKGKMSQDMILRLKNVKSGKVEIQIEWIDVPGSKGLR
ncbi:putative ADP-ribosylation factor GTPase-activating protein AGD13 [Heracleum sosnowskyi]|uniref:ADP-ribosylation factor GTPase-activating protein AGD13 n=1 Tax=Heracleum sosnowskyi TaxID=360622 RepID=A0AAD8MIZ8_9APIA|nr:putative ADP-ribosylation factor GTPase-activating protein AGD13 [Heracleum sosnowskyi]